MFFFITTKTINMFPECCKSEMCFFSHQVKMWKRLSKQWGGAPVLADKITTSNVVPYFQLMGLFLHRQSFSPWGICSLSIKALLLCHITTPQYGGISEINAKRCNALLCPEKSPLQEIFIKLLLNIKELFGNSLITYNPICQCTIISIL